MFTVRLGDARCSTLQFVRWAAVYLVGAILSQFVMNQACSMLRWSWSNRVAVSGL